MAILFLGPFFSFSYVLMKKNNKNHQYRLNTQAKSGLFINQCGINLVSERDTRRITASDWLMGVCNDHVTMRLRLCGPVTFFDSMFVAEGLMCQPLFRCNSAVTLWNIQKVRREQDRTFFTARIHIYVRTPPAVQEGERRKLLARCVESRRRRLSTFFF